MLSTIKVGKITTEERLRIRNAELQAEIRQRLPPLPRRKRLLELAISDAYQLIAWRFAGVSISKRDAYDLGMPERRWRRATKVLRRAGVWNRSDVVITDIGEARQAIDTLRRRTENSGEYRWLFGDR